MISTRHLLIFSRSQWVIPDLLGITSDHVLPHSTCSRRFATIARLHGLYTRLLVYAGNAFGFHEAGLAYHDRDLCDPGRMRAKELLFLAAGQGNDADAVFEVAGIPISARKAFHETPVQWCTGMREPSNMATILAP